MSLTGRLPPHLCVCMCVCVYVHCLATLCVTDAGGRRGRGHNNPGCELDPWLMLSRQAGSQAGSGPQPHSSRLGSSESPGSWSLSHWATLIVDVKGLAEVQRAQ